jgi:hypothetical protein
MTGKGVQGDEGWQGTWLRTCVETAAVTSVGTGVRYSAMLRLHINHDGPGLAKAGKPLAFHTTEVLITHGVCDIRNAEVLLIVSQTALISEIADTAV